MKENQGWRNVLRHPLLRKYVPLVHEDLTATYARDLQKWLVIAPIIGVITGLVATGLVVVILQKMWPPILNYYLAHHWAIVPGLVLGCLIAGLIMQFLTPNPDEHSTEEIIHSYHERQGNINMRPFVAKLAAAIATVGFGGSAALEGPGIYSGGAIGSWIWERFRSLRRFNLDARDRRIMLICGAAAGMSAVFRAPFTGIVFALEMPYKDDIAHEALVPALISSVVSFMTLGSFLGTAPLFDFATSGTFTQKDLLWCALLGLIIGLIAMAFAITFRRLRTFSVHLGWPHWLKMAVGGLLTGLCGVIFLHFYHGGLVPLGPNYEAVDLILAHTHGSPELVVFGVLKLAATAFTLGVGGVSAMFVPLFLSGGSFGMAFAQSIVHSSTPALYAAVGMAAFIAAGYKTPFAAVVFVAEATGGHAFIIPSLIGAAVAYSVSGDASASGDQRLHEAIRVTELNRLPVSEIMRTDMISVSADTTLREFAAKLSPQARHHIYPVFDNGKLIGTCSLWTLSRVPPEKWGTTHVRDITGRRIEKITPETDATEALHLLLSSGNEPMLLAVQSGDKIVGIVTKTNILQALKMRREDSPASPDQPLASAEGVGV